MLLAQSFHRSRATTTILSLGGARGLRRAALDTQCRVRRMNLPERIILADGNWTTQCPAKAMKFGGERWGLKDLDEALRVSGLLVHPILSGEIDGPDHSWDCAVLLWK